MVHLQDPELLSFIDIECYCWSTVLAEFTPMINAGMVFCDRHYGGINYPKVLVNCYWTCMSACQAPQQRRVLHLQRFRWACAHLSDPTSLVLL